MTSLAPARVAECACASFATQSCQNRWRKAARTANIPAASPTARTSAKVAAIESQGQCAPPGARCGRIATRAARVPIDSPATSSSAFSHKTRRATSAAESGGAQQCQLGATFDDVAQLHGGEAEGAEQ